MTTDAPRPSTSEQAGRTPTSSGPSSAEQLEQAAQQGDPGIVREFIQFLRENKAWWLTPILLALIILGLVAWLSASVVAPFIYPLF